jgi:hypothetical protein
MAGAPPARGPLRGTLTFHRTTISTITKTGGATTTTATSTKFMSTTTLA